MANLTFLDYYFVDKINAHPYIIRDIRAEETPAIIIPFIRGLSSYEETAEEYRKAIIKEERRAKLAKNLGRFVSMVELNLSDNLIADLEHDFLKLANQYITAANSDPNTKT